MEDYPAAVSLKKMTLLQIILSLFLLFALSRVFLQFRQARIKITELVFWSVIFLSAIVGVVDPQETTQLAKMLGIGRGVDLIVYASIAVLFYLIFRIYIFIENIRHEITDLVRKMAIEEHKRQKRRKR